MDNTPTTEKVLLSDGGQIQPNSMTFQPTGKSMQSALSARAAMGNAMEELGQRTRS